MKKASADGLILTQIFFGLLCGSAKGLSCWLPHLKGGKSVRGKVLQHFFATKPTGKGTGLGLSLAHEIVTQGHDGTLEVASQEGQGTDFIITLPSYLRAWYLLSLLLVYETLAACHLCLPTPSHQGGPARAQATGRE